MPGTKEIRAKIASIRNTQKITRAMQMVATSKMRRAQERMRAARPYAEKMRMVIGHLSKANPDFRHPFTIEREAKAVALLVVSTDRGLAGGLNVNLFRQALLALREWQQKDVEVSLGLLGAKGVAFFRRLRVPILAQATHLGDRPHIRDIIGTLKILLDAYRAGRIDRLLLVNNHFVNTMSQKAEVKQLLPIPAFEVSGLPEHWDYIYEPDASAILDGLLMRFVESQVYQAAVENVACEMAARMVAMKSATDNAGNLVEELRLVYNKARQAAITKELAEIVAGAAAV
jgi:F-type H+-transporting ATPase subunit gamma